MVRTVGKLTSILVLFLGYGLAVAATITMHMYDVDDGSLLVQAAAGRPFVIEISATDVGHVDAAPDVAGIEKFSVKNSSMRISIANGKTMLKYTYIVVINSPGSYVIGPATLKYQGQTLASNAVSLVVGNEQIEKVRRSHTTKQTKPVILRLSADKERVVVGECVTCKLRFLTADPHISFRNLIEQPSVDIRRKYVRGPIKGQEQISNVNYTWVEWEWQAYPQKPGSYTVPAYGADYEREIERDDLWRGFVKFLGNYSETKRIYSNALSLHVEAVPASAQTVQGIGTFTSVRMNAKPSIAKQGEGIVVAVEIIGDGDPDSIIFSLHGVPEKFKFYESKQEILNDSGGIGRGKRFEYIVQGLQTGSWQIPAQSFHYFDVRERSFKTLYSSPLSITVMPGKGTAQSDVLQKKGEKIDVHNSEESDGIAGIHTDHWMPVNHAAALPLWILLVLMVFPVLFREIYRGRFFFWHTNFKYDATKRARRAFVVAQDKIKLCKNKDGIKGIYAVFIELFSDRWHSAPARVSALYIQEKLKKLGMDDQQCEQWDAFFLKVQKAAFGGVYENDELCIDEALQWIKKLERML